MCFPSTDARSGAATASHLDTYAPEIDVQEAGMAEAGQ